MGRWQDLAKWEGPTVNQGGPLRSHRGLVLHIAEGFYDGTIAWQKNAGADVSSHFIIGRQGQVAQMVDTDREAWTQRAGNAAWLSAEFEGFTASHELHRPGWERLSVQQVEAAARLLARAHKVYGVPFTLATGPDSRGLGYHSMGGTAWGHLRCPGAPIIGQRGDVLARARAIAGVPDTTPPPHPAVADWTRKVIMSLPTIKRGATGKPVRRLQGLLVAAGQHTSVDGVYGPDTQRDVVAVQAAAGIARDGITGRDTWSVLLGERPA